MNRSWIWRPWSPWWNIEKDRRWLEQDCSHTYTLAHTHTALPPVQFLAGVNTSPSLTSSITLVLHCQVTHTHTLVAFKRPALGRSYLSGLDAEVAMEINRGCLHPCVCFRELASYRAWPSMCLAFVYVYSFFTLYVSVCVYVDLCMSVCVRLGLKRTRSNNLRIAQMKNHGDSV